ncbi:MAG: twin-arginine translocase subunit TatC [Armatimonadetes bacterium]|nr:twin-arginine translocase subunit TatC [Armatimonadota bacterium]
MRDSVEGSFWDHLEEARWGILRGLIYLLLGTLAAWAGRNWLFDLVRYPAEEGARRAGIADFAFRIFDPAGGIVLMMQTALVAGLILSTPLWLYEVARFVAPGLTPQERRVALLLVPAAVVLFVGGAAFCYWIAPAAFAFLFAFNAGLGVAPEVTLTSYLYFFLRLVVVFGLIFELPLVVMFLVHFGIMTSATLLRVWRSAVVVILLVSAFATPTTDPFTMGLMAGPMVLLYFGSVLLGRLVERRRGPVAAEDASYDPYGLGQREASGLGGPTGPTDPPEGL